MEIPPHHDMLTEFYFIMQMEFHYINRIQMPYQYSMECSYIHLFYNWNSATLMEFHIPYQHFIMLH